MIHPDVDTLLLHRDGELPPEETRAVTAHLDSCLDCRDEYEKLWASLNENVAAPPLALDSILNSIQQWTASGQAPAAGYETKARVLAEIGPYLGAWASARIIRPEQPECEELLGRLECVLSLFLGSKAASNLVSHAVDAAIARA